MFLQPNGIPAAVRSCSSFRYCWHHLAGRASQGLAGGLPVGRRPVATGRRSTAWHRAHASSRACSGASASPLATQRHSTAPACPCDKSPRLYGGGGRARHLARLGTASPGALAHPPISYGDRGCRGAVARTSWRSHSVAQPASGNPSPCSLSREDYVALQARWRQRRSGQSPRAPASHLQLARHSACGPHCTLPRISGCV